MNPKFEAKVRDAFPHSGAFDEDTADKVLDIISGRTDPMTYSDVEEWVRSCWHEPEKIDKKLCAINQILGGYGVEAIFGDSYTEPDMDYINLGDTYTTTIVFDRLKWKWRVMSWGDWVEEAEAAGRTYA